MKTSKEGRYSRIKEQLQDLFSRTSGMLPRMATLNALLYHKMDGFFWVGFYLLNEGKLLVGPYQGSLACMELPSKKGVCWTGITTGNTVIVPDVHNFPGHIACDSRSKSEIVVPVYDRNNKVIGVLDIDSREPDHFDQVDAENLGQIVALIFKG
ncbi:MAG: GAF domain-containing protein [Bacteroidales bacterium]|nr:GAF domain-containing protein [Bacteroidales bacterium]